MNRSLDEWYALLLDAAAKHGGKVLTPKSQFLHPRPTTTIFECKKGHQWKSNAYSTVTGGCWCRSCGMWAKRIRPTLKDLCDLAASKGGKCLSSEYIGIQQQHKWECALGHQWSAKPTNIKSGRWCPLCKLEKLSEKFRRKDAIACYAELAESRGGKLVSTVEPKNAHQQLEWECARGHRWRAKTINVQNGRWCPQCSSGIGERICRVYFEELFQHPFPSQWPEWLIIEGTRRQLDGYCEDLKLAFEHQGQQHYRKIAGGKFTRRTVEEETRCDLQKIALCRERGVTLLQIPEIPQLTPLHAIRLTIKEECLKNGVPIPSEFDTQNIDLKRAWDNDLMLRLQEAARVRGGKCLGNDFVGVRQKYIWECEKGHQWEASAESILHRKSWCRKCHLAKMKERFDSCLWKPTAKGPDLRKLKLMREAAIRRGGLLLISDTEYIGVREKYRWRCRHGHEWKASGDSILHAKSWCAKCHRAKVKKKHEDE